MKKEEIRKEFFKLKIKGHTNNQCRKILLAQFSYEVNIRTLRRWTNRLNKTEWDLRDKSKRPNKIYSKVNLALESKIVELRNIKHQSQEPSWAKSSTRLKPPESPKPQDRYWAKFPKDPLK